MRLGYALERLSGALHYSLTGYDGTLCARAAWRPERRWRVFRRVLDAAHWERNHCEKSLWRCFVE